MKILQVSPHDVAGGAERSARNLAAEYRKLGHDSWLVVGSSLIVDPNVFVLQNDVRRNRIVRLIDRVRNSMEASSRPVRGAGRLLNLARALAEPARALNIQLGREDFDFPATKQLLDLPPSRPDLVHLHNLHGGYFDLRLLPALSAMVPTILNVRDGWLMTGHCAFGMECQRWTIGCGECPDLQRFPAVKRDATAYNWRTKRDILFRSRLYVVTPSRWMMDQVTKSIIAPAAVLSKVIPNGVDTDVFKPAGRKEARAALGLPHGAAVLLLGAHSLRSNPWKDFDTLRSALELIGRTEWPRRIIAVALGEAASVERIGSVELRFVPFVSDSATLADYYRASDVYLHAAHVESFGNVLLEARACGTPVIATAVGGIPEQIRGHGSDGITDGSGILVEPADAAAFAEAVTALITNETLRARLAINGLKHVQEEFTLTRQAERFIEWYSEVVADHGSRSRTAR